MPNLEMKTSLSTLLLATLAIGCGGPTAGGDPAGRAATPPDTPAPPTTVAAKSSKLRNLNPIVSSTALTDLVEGNSALAFDLYQALKDGDDNLFMSPHSLSLALAMTYAGARGQTETEMAQTLHFDLPQADLHAAFNHLDLALASRGQGAQGADGAGFRLNIMNSVWGQAGYPFLVDFLDTLAINYGAGLQLTDFAGAPDPARVAINDWVATATEQRIQDLLADGMITMLTRLVMTNAVYFNAAWKEQFVPRMTHAGDFTLLDGSTVSVPMMSNQAQDAYRHAAGPGYEALEMLYDGDELSMLVIVPDSGQFTAIESSMDASFVAGIVADLADTNMTISLPRWQTRSRWQLEETLAQMGMASAFSSDADLSGMTGNRDLFIAHVVHEAFVSVDEAGTEAGASTAVVVSFGIPQALVVDRPFLYLVRDQATGAILFLGRVLNPAL